MGDKDPVLSVVDGLADAALLFDRDLRLVHFNRSLVILSGLRVRALRRELSSAETPFAVFGRSKDHEVALEVLALGRPRRLDEVMITTSAGAKHITIITMIPILEEGLATGLIYVMRDVTAESDQHANYKELLRSERARAEELECRVEVRTRELTLALQEVTRLARTDPLTGALNRRAFLAHAEQAIDMARRHDRCVGLLMCDLDHFKRVNDNYGHQAGDALLVRVVESMNEMVRTTDKVGRFGGEEFALLLTETVRPAVMSIAARCNESIRKIDTSKLVAGRPWKQTISIGCAIFPDDASDFDELVGKADLALYQAKETGRDKNVRYSSQLEVDAADEKAGEVGHRVLVFGSGQGVSPEILENMEEKHQVIVANALEEAIEFVENDTFDVLLVFDNTRDSSALDFFSASLPHQLSAVRILVVQTSDRFSALRKNGVHYIDKFLLKQDFEEHAEGIVEDGLSRREVELRRLLDKRSDRTGRTSLGDRKFEKLLRMGAFQIAFQPIVDASSLRIRGYEAFCRPVSHLFSVSDGSFRGCRSTGPSTRA